jgi:hypothetical protein
MAYIALLDIIGLKNWENGLSGNELSQFMKDELPELLEVSVTFKDKWCSILRMEDYFVIYTDETYLEFGHLLLSAARFSSLMLLKGLPIKGAITSGELIVDKAKGSAVGAGLERTKNLNNEQHWGGIIIDSIDTPSPTDISNLFFCHQDMMRDLMLSGVVCKYSPPDVRDNEMEYKLYVAWPYNFVKVPRDHVLKCLYNQPITLASKKELNSKLKNSLKRTKEFFDWYRSKYQDKDVKNNLDKKGSSTNNIKIMKKNVDFDWNKSVFIAHASEDKKKQRNYMKI